MSNSTTSPVPALLQPTSPAAAAAQRRGQVAVEVYDTRRARLRLLIEERAGGSQRAFAKALGYTRSNIFNFLSTTYNHGRSMGERAARKLEHKAGLPYGWLDQAIISNNPEALLVVRASSAGNLDVDAERVMFEQAWRPFAPRSHFKVNAEGDFVHKAMRDRLAGWLTALDSNRLNSQPVEFLDAGGHEAGGQIPAGSAETRMDAGLGAVVKVGAPRESLSQLANRWAMELPLIGKVEVRGEIKNYIDEEIFRASAAATLPARAAGTERIDLDKLEALADAVGGEDWTTDDQGVVYGADGDSVCVCHANAGAMPEFIYETDHAAFIAAANPAAVLAIIALARRAAQLPKTGITAAVITMVQRDLARLAAGSDSEVASASVRAQAVIEGLLAGLDVEQLS